MADLSSRLSERFAGPEPAADFDAESEEREQEARQPRGYHPFRRPPPRAAMFRLPGIRRGEFFSGKRAPPPEPPAERATPPRGRTIRLLLGFTLGVTAAIAGLAAFHTVPRKGATPVHQAAHTPAKAGPDMSAVVPPPPAAPKAPTDSDIAGSAKSDNPPASSIDSAATDKTAAAAPPSAAPQSAAPPSPAPSSSLQGAVAADQTAPATANAPQPAAEEQQALAPYEVMEVQTRLQWLGFGPGGLDGISGRLTSAAVKRYEASKGLPQTGNIDQSLLKELRQDSLRPAKP